MRRKKKKEKIRREIKSKVAKISFQGDWWWSKGEWKWKNQRRGRKEGIKNETDK